MARLPVPSACVRVGPPLSASGPRLRAAPNDRLLPLVPDGLKPGGLPTALKFRFTVPVLEMSGAAVLVLPETIELTTVSVPMAVPGPRATAMPPALALLVV